MLSAARAGASAGHWHESLGGLRDALLAEGAYESSRPIDRIAALAVIYLAIPNLVFFFGWFRPIVALPLAAVTLWALWQGLPWRSLDNSRPCSARILLYLALIATVWCAFGGAGHLSFANPDWRIRDAVFGDLMFSQWPPSYGAQGDAPLLLRSAIGYFLPAAAVAKTLGVQYGDLLLFAWTSLGTFIFLCLLPLPGKPGGRFLLCILAVLFFSGMDIVGILVITGVTPLFPLRLEWWTKFSYSSLSGQMFWAPNHALPIWIGMALFLRHWTTSAFARFAAAYMPLTLLWTPFAVVGLAPFFGLSLLRWTRERSNRPTLVQIAFVLLVGGLVCVFLTLNVADIPTKTGFAHAGGNAPFWRHYAVFVLTEFLTLALLLWARTPRPGGVFFVSVAVLLGLPFVFFGPSNDLLLRASTPPLVALLVLTLIQLQAGQQSNEKTPLPWPILAVLLIGANTPFNEMWRARSWTVNPANYTRNLIEADGGVYPPHYVGKLDKPWLASLLKPPQAVGWNGADRQ